MARQLNYKIRRFIRLFQMNGLCERAISRRIPRRHADPFLACCIERDLKAMASEGWEIRRGNDFPAGCMTVAPYQLDEFQRECPFDLSRVGPFIPGAFDTGIS